MAITGEYRLQQNAINFGALTSRGTSKGIDTSGYHQASIQQGVPTTNPAVYSFPSVEDMELADKIASSSNSINPYAVSAAPAIGKVNPADTNMFLRGQNESHELENCDVSGSHLGKSLDLQGIENKAWGKEELELI
ncbi:hypothetical protein IJ425_02045 [bacterium]|nr:hypothetical protein [bacterium]